MKSALKVACLVCVSILVATVSGLATTITEPVTFSPTVTPFLVSSSPVPQFNPALGTLTSIEIDLSGFTTGTATVTNGSSTSATYTFSIQTTLELFDPTSSPVISISPTFSGSIFVPAGGSNTSGVLTSPTATNSTTLLSGFGLYEGTGTYDFTLSGTGFGTGSGPVPFTLSETNTASASGDVIYTYTVTRSSSPEPSALLLLGSGAGLLGLRLRRSRSSRG